VAAQTQLSPTPAWLGSAAQLLLIRFLLAVVLAARFLR
jgi:hypothetical protein